MPFHLEIDSDSVRQTHSAPPLYVQQTDSVRHVLAQLKVNKTGSAFVLDDGKLAGIFTERDALKIMANGGNLDAEVSQVMTANPVTVHEGDSVSAAIRTMSKGGYRRVPIVDDKGQPTGAVKASGILRYLVEHFPQSIYNLPPAPDNASKEREGA